MHIWRTCHAMGDFLEDASFQYTQVNENNTIYNGFKSFYNQAFAKMEIQKTVHIFPISKSKMKMMPSNT